MGYGGRSRPADGGRGSVTTLEGAPLLYGKASARFINANFVAWGRMPLAPAG